VISDAVRLEWLDDPCAVLGHVRLLIFRIVFSDLTRWALAPGPPNSPGTFTGLPPLRIRSMAFQATALSPGAEVCAPAAALGCLQQTEPQADVSKDVSNE